MLDDSDLIEKSIDRYHLIVNAKLEEIQELLIFTVIIKKHERCINYIILFGNLNYPCDIAFCDISFESLINVLFQFLYNKIQISILDWIPPRIEEID